MHRVSIVLCLLVTCATFALSDDSQEVTSSSRTNEDTQDLVVDDRAPAREAPVEETPEGPTEGPPEEHPGTGTNQSTEVIVDFILTNHQVSRLSYQKDEEEWRRNFDPGCRTVYILPDYLLGRMKIYQALIDAYLQLGECYNLIFCDWSSAYNPDYIAAAGAVRGVGEIVGKHVIKLFGEVDNGKSLEMVGHGLGAHLAGCAGQTTIDIIPVDLIYGLSPRGDLFTDDYKAYEEDRLTGADGSKVVCLHTILSGVGSSQPCGKIDFYANQGQKQPGIIFEYQGFYSHLRAVSYFREALSSEAFVARGALGYPVTRFGRTMSRNTPQGKYYFKTNSRSPFGLN